RPDIYFLNNSKVQQIFAGYYYLEAISVQQKNMLMLQVFCASIVGDIGSVGIWMNEKEIKFLSPEASLGQDYWKHYSNNVQAGTPKVGNLFWTKSNILEDFQNLMVSPFGVRAPIQWNQYFFHLNRLQALDILENKHITINVFFSNLKMAEHGSIVGPCHHIILKNIYTKISKKQSRSVFSDQILQLQLQIGAQYDIRPLELNPNVSDNTTVFPPIDKSYWPQELGTRLYDTTTKITCINHLFGQTGNPFLYQAHIHTSRNEINLILNITG
ncbi:hypothetical protein ACJX0J_015060, partial [Zea mays]